MQNLATTMPPADNSTSRADPPPSSKRPNKPILPSNTAQYPGENGHAEIINEIIDTMEQGILVWSHDAVCIMHNQRVFDVLELRETDLYPGMKRSEFLQVAVDRGEIKQSQMVDAEARFKRTAPFSFDRIMPSGRVVGTTARPRRSGGFVVTFTDVSETRRKESELEQAERRAKEALNYEQQRKHENKLLSELGEWLQSSKTLEELFKIISKFMTQLFPGTSGDLYIYSNSRDVLDLACHWNCEPKQTTIEPDDCWALRRGRMYKFGTGIVSFPCLHLEKNSQPPPDNGYVCIPIVAHGDTVGLLHISFDESDIEHEDNRGEWAEVYQFAVQCAEQISLAIANVKLRDELHDQSTRDLLTGLYNRRYFLESCRREFSLAERQNTAISLISFDADNFKMFNDNHGHDAGDTVLRSISETVHRLFSNGEVSCRFGGEEFVILLPGAPIQSALEAAETLRAEIEKLTIRYGGQSLPRTTISIGVASYPDHGTSITGLIKAADDALYCAKANGKNTVCPAAHKKDASSI